MLVAVLQCESSTHSLVCSFSSHVDFYNRNETSDVAFNTSPAFKGISENRRYLDNFTLEGQMSLRGSRRKMTSAKSLPARWSGVRTLTPKAQKQPFRSATSSIE